MGDTRNYTSESALAWIAPRWRELLATMQPRDRHATIERARCLAQLRPRSYLARHLSRLYGVKL